MSYIGKAKSRTTSIEVSINKCNQNDVSDISKMIRLNFDEISENLPSRNKIENAISIGNILKIVILEQIVAFLWYESKPMVTEIKYLFISADHRGKRLSINLLEEYNRRVLEIRKKQLWVRSDNVAAIRLYSSYGYKNEEISDYIYLWEANN
jgi:predicted GNAT family acetyltransferase